MKNMKKLKEILIKKSKSKDCDNTVTITQLDIYASVRKVVPTKPSKYMESKKIYNRKDKSWRKGII